MMEGLIALQQRKHQQCAAPCKGIMLSPVSHLFHSSAEEDKINLIIKNIIKYTGANSCTTLY